MAPGNQGIRHRPGDAAAPSADQRMKPGIAARLLFGVMDLVYGAESTLAKFRVLEIIARVPYIAWEQVAYVVITHTHSTPGFARDVHREVEACRAQQDNELFHLLILEELLQQRGERQGFWRFRVLPQIVAWIYYHVSWLLYVLRPRLSYELNAQFEEHAEFEYRAYVASHPELEDERWDSVFRDEYGSFDTVGEVLLQIAIDEAHHKDASLAHIANPRFVRARR